MINLLFYLTNSQSGVEVFCTYQNQVEEVKPLQDINSYWWHEQGVTCMPRMMPQFP